MQPKVELKPKMKARAHATSTSSWQGPTPEEEEPPCMFYPHSGNPRLSNLRLGLECAY